MCAGLQECGKTKWLMMSWVTSETSRWGLRRWGEGGGGGGSLSELRPPISNPLCGDVSRTVSKGTQQSSVWAARRPVCIPGLNISVAGAQLSADRLTSDSLGNFYKMGKLNQRMLRCSWNTYLLCFVMTACFTHCYCRWNFGARRLFFFYLFFLHKLLWSQLLPPVLQK